MKLSDAMPHEFLGCEYAHTPSRKYADVDVVSEHKFAWPGKQRHVIYWVKLSNGKAVGWNENPSRGWSFPVITIEGDQS